MARAYAFCESESAQPLELEAAKLIGRFGVEAVYGRACGVTELRRMSAALNIESWYHERQRAENWAKWAEDHRNESAALNRAMKAAHRD